MRLFHKELFSIFTILFFLIIGTIDSYAQGETNNWFFGQKAGLDFNATPTIKQTGGKVNHTLNGNATSMSDSAGNLLFYSDGKKVWDKNHNVMPNGTGLKGYVFWENLIAVPKPGTNNYYLIAVDFSTTNFTYELLSTEIDMSLNGGLGDVVTGTKNNLIIALGGFLTSGISAVHHQNRKDFWVVYLDNNTDEVVSHLVNSGGISTPVKSPAATGTFTYYYNLKISPDGKKLAYYNYNSWPVFELGIQQFDDLTGKATTIYEYPANYISVYGIEFSACSRFLYSVEWGTGLVQYDTKALNTAPNYMTVLSTQTFTWGGGIFTGMLTDLQLGSDGKVYVSRQDFDSLGVINSPDKPGLLCDFEINGISVGASQSAAYMLPNFVVSFLNRGFRGKGRCLGDTTYFESIADYADSIKWDFDDPSTGSDNFSTLDNPGHVFSDSGVYEIMLIAYDSARIDTYVKEHTILYFADWAGNDTTLCLGDTLALDAYFEPSAAHYIWSTGDTIDSYTVSYEATYTVEAVFDSNCSFFDTVTVLYGDSTVYSYQQFCDSILFTLDNSGFDSIHINDGQGGIAYFDSLGVLFSAPGSTPITIDLWSNNFQCYQNILDTLMISKSTFDTFYVDLCLGDVFSLFGMNYYGNDTIHETYPVNYQCDSNIVTFLNFSDTFNAHFADTICPGDFALVNGNQIFIGGMVRDTFHSINGCDSIENTMVTFHPIYSYNDSVTICSNEYYFAEGAWQNIAGNYYDTLSTINGCDSVIVTVLSLDPVNRINVAETICDNDSVWVNIRYVSQAGTYIDTFINQYNCDSIITTTVSLLPTYDLQFTKNICLGDSILIHGVYRDFTGSFSQSFTSSQGCDSLSTVQLNVHAQSYTTLNPVICEGQSHFAGGGFQTTSGTYNDVYSNVHGCDSFVTTQLTVIPLPPSNINGDSVVCYGSEGQLIAPAGYTYQWSNGSANQFIDLEILKDENIDLTVTDSYGCSSFSSHTVLVDLINFELKAEPDSVINLGETIGIYAEGEFGFNPIYQWIPKEEIQLNFESGILAQPLDSVRYCLNVITENGCFNTKCITIEVIPPDNNNCVFVPTGFSPNDDGANDFFLPQFLCPDIEIQQFQVFDRWGELVYDHLGLKGRQKGWDGIYLKRKAKLGVYSYQIRVLNARNGVVSQKTGNVTLIR